jgi:phosphate starvation-inducible PhoH-like protein
MLHHILALTKENILSKRKTSAVRSRDQDPRFTPFKHPSQEKTFYMHESKTIDFMQERPKTKAKRTIELIPKSTNQEHYIQALLDEDTDIVVVSGPAGTGKTYLAILAAIKALRAGECKRIVLTRPAVAVEDEDHGFLPGDLNEKLAPWVRPMVDILHEYYTVRELTAMMAEQIVEFSPLGFMRGRTFKDSIIILDEGQNAKPGQLKMLMTRIGYNSKIIVTGDTDQTDQKKADNGLLDLVNRLSKRPTPGITTCEFEVGDVQRHRIIGSILKLYE